MNKFEVTRKHLIFGLNLPGSTTIFGVEFEYASIIFISWEHWKIRHLAFVGPEKWAIQGPILKYIFLVPLDNRPGFYIFKNSKVLAHQLCDVKSQ